MCDIVALNVCVYYYPLPCKEAEFKEKHGVMGPYTGVDYNLTLCPLQSRLQHIYHGQPYAKVDLNPMLGSTLSPQSGTLDLASVCIQYVYNVSCTV
jgi:hypothetical protein